MTVLLGLAACLRPAGAQVGDPSHWEGFQGNAGHTGVVAVTAPSAYQPLWVARPDPPPTQGRATAAVYNGKVVISDISPPTIPGCKVPEEYAILAYHPADGRQLWRTPTRGKLVGSPHIAGNLVFAVVWDCPPSGNYADSSTLYAIDSRDGQVVWQQALEGTEAGPPVVAEGLVIVPGRKLQTLFAYDALSGAPRWQAPLLDASRSTAQAAAVLDGSVFAVDDKHLYAFDLATGTS